MLVTGAAGNIGAYFAEHAPDRYELRLMVHTMNEDAEALKQYGEVVTGELDDLDKLKQLCEGIDTVVHMAGDPSPSAVWEDLLEANIVGTYNMCIAAKAAGCRRVIYASSIHAVSGYPSDVQVKTSEPVNPGDLYGVTKCFGEAMGRYMAEKEGLSVIALRIGAFQPPEARAQDRRCVDARRLGLTARPAAVDRTLHRRRKPDVRRLSWPEQQSLQASRYLGCARTGRLRSAG